MMKFFIVGLWWTSVVGAPIVATVNVENITLPEFLLFAGVLRTKVINDYRMVHNSGFGIEFWETEINGTTPMEVLKKRTLDTLIQVKIQQISARKAGLVADISYSGFQKALENENKRRLTAKKSGEVIYGPVQYSEGVYYNYLFSNMVIKLKEHLARYEFGITREKLNDAYLKDKDSLYSKGFYTVIRLTNLAPVTGKSDAEGGKTFIHPETTLIFNDSVFTPEDDDPLRSMVRAAAGNLSTGQSIPVEFEGKRYVIMVKEKAPLGYRSYEECSTSVRIRLVDQMYTNYLRDLVKQAKCETNTEEYRKIHF